MTVGRALLIVLAGCLIWLTVAQTRLVSPTPQTESAFLKEFTPDKVIDRYKIDEFSEQSSVATSGANHGFATHAEEFEPTLVINAGDRIALMQALRDDIATRLATQRAEIVQESGNAIDGFCIKYAVGQSEGTVAMEPVKSVASSSLAGAGSGPDRLTVSLRIRIDEKWFEAGGKAKSKKASSLGL